MAFVPCHVGSIGATWCALVGCNQCFFAALGFDDKFSAEDITASIGNHFGKWWVVMAYHNTWFGPSKIYICNNVGK